MKKDRSAILIVAIVGIVAVAGIMIMVFNQARISSDYDKFSDATGNAARQKTCTGATTQSCSIANGQGMQTRTCDSKGRLSAWSICTATACNSGYVLEAGVCNPMSIPMPPPPPAVPTIQ